MPTGALLAFDGRLEGCGECSKGVSLYIVCTCRVGESGVRLSLERFIPANPSGVPCAAPGLVGLYPKGEALHAPGFYFRLRLVV